MAIKLNIEPYYDDFNVPTDIDGLTPKEKYNQILFRPGHALQARELTQMQSILQNQVASVGDHLFKEGSIIVPGSVHIHNRIDYLKITTDLSQISTLVGTELVSGTSIFKVLHVIEAINDDPVTIYGNYVSGEVFDEGTSITFVDVDDSSVEVVVDSIGHGSLVSLDEGIYYLKKNFVIVKSSTIILSKYSTEVTYDIGLKVSEEVITSGSDVSLNDNALGTPNESAPGAHRYSITTELVKRAISEPQGNFVLLVRIEAGIITKHARDTDYAVLEDTLARRTFDESGNYAVNPFPASIKNHVSATPDDTKLTIGIEPSKAYVRGYEIETLSTTDVAFDKARDSDLATDKLVNLNFANTITVLGMIGIPDVNTFESVEIRRKNADGDTQIGTCRVRSFEITGGRTYSEVDPEIGNITGVFSLNIFDADIDFGNWSYDANAGDDVYIKSYGFDASAPGNGGFAGKVIVHSLAADSLLFPLPYTRIKSCNSELDPLEALDFNYSYSIIKTFTPSQQSGGAVTFTCNTEGEHFAPFDDRWSLVNTTDGEHLTYIESSNVTIDETNNPPKVTFTGLIVSGTDGTDGKPLKLIAPVHRTLSHKQKTLHSANVILPVATYNNYVNLDHCDIQNVVSIIENSQDVTKHFLIDNGQRDTHYGVGAIKRRPDTNFTVTGDLSITYNYFEHGTGDFFTVDSYAGESAYEDIPSHNGVELRSSVDFRPRMNNGGGNFTGNGASVGYCPIPGSSFTTDIQYYLNRIDKVYLDKDGEFAVLKGVSDINPSEPGIPKDSMVLYNLRIPAYTLSPGEVEIEYVDNKRYTMRDIGKLENRINTLEYYTVLSLLEKEASDKQILGDGNISKFKSGFLVDSFQSTNVANVTSLEYCAGIDRDNGVLRPLFSESNVAMEIDDTSTAVVTGDLVTLPYTTKPIIEQLQYSESVNVNPYDVFNWGGTLKLSPETDEWKDTDRRPNVIINNDGVFDAMKAIANEAVATGTVWNSWTTNWTGSTVKKTRSGSGNVFETTTTTKSGTKAREGIKTAIGTDTISTNVGDRIVEINFAPFMRSRMVTFEGTRLKPNSILYAFFDGTPVSDYVNQVDMDNLTVDQQDAIAESVTTGINNVISNPLIASVLTTDDNGSIKGTFYVPNNETLNFNTGDKTFLLTSSPSNDPEATNITFAAASYTAKGLIETKENVSISTRVPTIDRTEVDQTKAASKSTSTKRQIAWADPLAQSILIDLNGGAFITSLDLFFNTKDTNIPVEVQIREMDQGIPTQKVVPFSRKTLNPDAVNIPDAVSVAPATTFTFDSPVYLQDGIEYCFVIMANSNEYTVRVASIGGEDANGDRINKQPYNGVMFKSQNASTWTPDQNKDITFRMTRAVFSAYATVKLKNTEVQRRALANDPFQTIINSSDVIVSHKNHGLHNGDTTTLNYAGDSSINGIPVEEIKAAHTVKNVERDHYTITTATAATGTGIDGDYDATAGENLAWNTLYPMIQEMTLPSTGMTWAIKDTRVNSDGSYIMSNSYAPIIINSNYTPQTARVVLSGNTHSLEFVGILGTDKDNVSPVIDMQRCSAITISNRINRPAAAGTPSDNWVNPVANYLAETDPTSTSSLAKYLTKTVQLDNGANELKLFLDINRPNNTNVDIYYKVGSEASLFDDQAWVVLPTVDGAPVEQSDSGEYIEHEFSAGQPSEFTLFSVKIVFQSYDTSKIPSCKNLRAIALLA